MPRAAVSSTTVGAAQQCGMRCGVHCQGLRALHLCPIPFSPCLCEVSHVCVSRCVARHRGARIPLCTACTMRQSRTIVVNHAGADTHGPQHSPLAAQCLSSRSQRLCQLQRHLLALLHFLQQRPHLVLCARHLQPPAV